MWYPQNHVPGATNYVGVAQQSQQPMQIMPSNLVLSEGAAGQQVIFVPVVIQPQQQILMQQYPDPTAEQPPPPASASQTKPAAAPESQPSPQDTSGNTEGRAYLNLAPPLDQRPCKHNEWDDVRTRRKVKIYQCRVCLSKWKITGGSPNTRCLYFVQGKCDRGERCRMLHVYRKRPDKDGREQLFENYISNNKPAVNEVVPNTAQALQAVRAAAAQAAHVKQGKKRQTSKVQAEAEARAVVSPRQEREAAVRGIHAKKAEAGSSVDVEDPFAELRRAISGGAEGPRSVLSSSKTDEGTGDVLSSSSEQPPSLVRTSRPPSPAGSSTASRGSAPAKAGSSQRRARAKVSGGKGGAAQAQSQKPKPHTGPSTQRPKQKPTGYAAKGGQKQAPATSDVGIPRAQH